MLALVDSTQKDVKSIYAISHFAIENHQVYVMATSKRYSRVCTAVSPIVPSGAINDVIHER